MPKVVHLKILSELRHAHYACSYCSKLVLRTTCRSCVNRLLCLFRIVYIMIEHRIACFVGSIPTCTRAVIETSATPLTTKEAYRMLTRRAALKTSTFRKQSKNTQTAINTYPPTPWGLQGVWDVVLYPSPNPSLATKTWVKQVPAGVLDPRGSSWSVSTPWLFVPARKGSTEWRKPLK